MSVERRLDAADRPDSETTAELPVLDPAGIPSDRGSDEPGITDKWVDPQTGELSGRTDRGQLARLEQELHALRGARAAAEERADASARELAAAAHALSAANGRTQELEQRLQARAHADAALLAERDSALARLGGRLNEIERQSQARLEALTSLEGRRGLFETLLRGLDGELALAQGRVSELEAEVAALRAAAEPGARGGRSHEPGSDLEQQRIETLERDLAEARARLEERTTTLVNAESDLRAAEDMIHRLESDLSTQNERIEELTRINDDWRSTLEAARESLEERDALIRKLESQAAYGTALLEKIEQVAQDLGTRGAERREPLPASATRVLIRADGDREVVYVLGRRTSIGRTPDNDLQLDTKFVSRHHAIILAGPVQTIVEDLSSTNGVLVNGRRVSRHSLKDGDAVVIGKTKFLFAVRPAHALPAPL